MKAYTLSALLIAATLAACGDKAPATTEAAASAPAAQAQAAPAAAAPASVPASVPAPAASVADLAKGEQVYTATCLACHGAGVLGAPKFGDAAAWQPRVAKGMEVLYGNAVNGFKMMPPRGGNAVLKDDDMRAAVDYMASKVR